MDEEEGRGGGTRRSDEDEEENEDENEVEEEEEGAIGEVLDEEGEVEQTYREGSLHRGGLRRPPRRGSLSVWATPA